VSQRLSQNHETTFLDQLFSYLNAVILQFRCLQHRNAVKQTQFNRIHQTISVKLGHGWDTVTIRESTTMRLMEAECSKEAECRKVGGHPCITVFHLTVQSHTPVHHNKLEQHHTNHLRTPPHHHTPQSLHTTSDSNIQEHPFTTEFLTLEK
jgi:hypothetical protein